MSIPSSEGGYLHSLMTYKLTPSKWRAVINTKNHIISTQCKTIDGHSGPQITHKSVISNAFKAEKSSYGTLNLNDSEEGNIIIKIFNQSLFLNLHIYIIYQRHIEK